MNDLILPVPIAAYFSADARHPEAVVDCFTEQATVKDESRTYTGIEAIKAWKTSSSTKYTYIAEPFALDRNADLQIVRVHVAGNFPGSPVDLQYQFRLDRGLIAALEITA